MLLEDGEAAESADARERRPPGDASSRPWEARNMIGSIEQLYARAHPETDDASTNHKCRDERRCERAPPPYVSSSGFGVPHPVEPLPHTRTDE